MRSPLLVLGILLLSGCSGDGGGGEAPVGPEIDCYDLPPVERVLFFGPGHTLTPVLPAAGSEPGNAFSSGFLTNDLKEWLADPAMEWLWIEGDVILEFWARSTGSPAPLAVGGDPGEGYHFFNQFGSDRSLQPAYATEYSAVTPTPGTVDHYSETLTMPPGGFVVEAGDRVRVLLTDLALDGPDGSGHEILYGGETPSQVRFTARCLEPVQWLDSVILERTVDLPANQGLLTGAVPPGEGNQVAFQFQMPAGTSRLRIDLVQDADRNPVKDDIDVVLLNTTGYQWSIGSPYSDESGTLWGANLVALKDYFLTVQVNSYSGVAYTGTLTVTASTSS